MLSRELEETLRRAMANAASRSHEFATLEHLLMALTEDTAALEVLNACEVNVDELKQKLTDFIEDDLASIINPAIEDSVCLLYTSPSPRDATLSRMPSSA